MERTERFYKTDQPRYWVRLLHANIVARSSSWPSPTP